MRTAPLWGTLCWPQPHVPNLLAVSAALIAVVLPHAPAAAHPVPPTNGEIVGTFGIGTYDPSGVPARVICAEPTSLTGIRAFRVDNEAPEPITGIQGICSDVFADDGVVTIDDPQLSVIGVEQDDIRDSACPLGAVVTGFRGRAGDGDRRNGEGGTGRAERGGAKRGRRNGSAQWC